MSTADEDKLPPVGAAEDAPPKETPEVAVEKRLANMDITGETSDLKSRKTSQLGNREANTTNALLPKLLRTTRMLLSSRSFFYSYDLDITRRLGGEIMRNPEIPLSKSVDPLVSFWSILNDLARACPLTSVPSSFGTTIWHCLSLKTGITHSSCLSCKDSWDSGLSQLTEKPKTHLKPSLTRTKIHQLSFRHNREPRSAMMTQGSCLR